MTYLEELKNHYELCLKSAKFSAEAWFIVISRSISDEIGVAIYKGEGYTLIYLIDPAASMFPYWEKAEEVHLNNVAQIVWERHPKLIAVSPASKMEIEELEHLLNKKVNL